MKGMKDAKEFPDAPPAGVWFSADIVDAEAAVTGEKARTPGVPQLKLTIEGREGDYDGYVMFDNLITDGAAKGAGMAKPRLRQLCAMLGIDIDSDVEVLDSDIAEKLKGMTIRVLGQHKPRQKANAAGEYVDVVEYQNGKPVPVMRLVPKEYAAIDTAPAQAAAPVQAPAQQTAQPPFAAANGTPAPAAATQAPATSAKPKPAWAKAAAAPAKQ